MPYERRHAIALIGKLWPSSGLTDEETDVLMGKVARYPLAVVERCLRDCRAESRFNKPNFPDIIERCRESAGFSRGAPAVDDGPDYAGYTRYMTARYKRLAEIARGVDPDELREFAKMVKERVRPDVWAHLLGAKARDVERRKGASAADAKREAQLRSVAGAVIDAADPQPGESGAWHPACSRLWLSNLDPVFVLAELIEPFDARWRDFPTTKGGPA